MFQHGFNDVTDVEKLFETQDIPASHEGKVRKSIFKVLFTYKSVIQFVVTNSTLGWYFSPQSNDWY